MPTTVGEAASYCQSAARPEMAPPQFRRPRHASFKHDFFGHRAFLEYPKSEMDQSLLFEKLR